VKHRTVSGVTPDCLVCQRSNGYFTRNGRLQQHSMRYSARQSQSTHSWRTGQSTGPVRCTTGQPRGPTSQSPNGRLTWLAHRTVSGGAPDCPVRHATAVFQRPFLVVGTINTPTTPTFNGIQVSTLLHLTRAITFNTRHTKEIKSSPNSTQSFSD
jgi:hypothetical protein